MAFSHPNEYGSIFFHRYKIVKLCIPIGIRMVDAGQAVGLAVDADKHIMTRFLILHLEETASSVAPSAAPGSVAETVTDFFVSISYRPLSSECADLPDRSLEFQGLLSENNCETGVLQNHSLY